MKNRNNNKKKKKKIIAGNSGGEGKLSEFAIYIRTNPILRVLAVLILSLCAIFSIARAFNNFFFHLLQWEVYVSNQTNFMVWFS